MKKHFFLLKIIGFALAIFLLGCALCACGDSTSPAPMQTEESKVKEVVMSKSNDEITLQMSFFKVVYGVELQKEKCRTTISSVSKQSDTEYTVYGSVTLCDAYGTQSSRNFNCSVTRNSTDSDYWWAGSFNYVGQWS